MIREFGSVPFSGVKNESTVDFNRRFARDGLGDLISDCSTKKFGQANSLHKEEPRHRPACTLHVFWTCICKKFNAY